MVYPPFLQTIYAALLWLFENRHDLHTNICTVGVKKARVKPRQRKFEVRDIGQEARDLMVKIISRRIRKG